MNWADFNQQGRVIMVALFKFYWLVYIFHGGTRINKKWYILLMWCAALCSGLVALPCGWAEL